jgi:eukaryotic-like serine/threonine-protein kinase
MIGSVVGSYKIIDKIGEGGMGAVFKGVDLMLEREVAIKMLRPELARQPNVVERFRTEAVTLAKLNHSNVATLHSFFRQGEDFFMVMEFVRGQTLDDVIRAQGAMECKHAVNLFCMALEGIDHAHKMGIVHRDIKPANMMLTDTGSIKVMDFGIARVLGTDRMTKVGHLIGTVEYMSPEQVRGEEADARSDIYSLGILLYEMLTGRVPFISTSEYELMRCQIEDAPDPPRNHAPHIPLAVEQAIMRSLAKMRDARYQSAGEFRAMLMGTNIALVTTPLTPKPVARTGGYAAPATHVDHAMRMTPPSGDVPKPTRLSGEQNLAPAVAGNEMKATRLGQSSAAIPYPQGVSASYAPQPVGQSASRQLSFLSRLNWKHYVAAGALFFVMVVAVVAGTLVLLRGGAKPDEVVPPSSVASPPPEVQSPDAPSEQSEAAPVPAPEQSEPAPAPAQSVEPPPTQPAPVNTGDQTPVAGSAAPGGSSGRTRTGATKTAEVPPESQQPPPTQPPPQTQPPTKQEKAAPTKPETEKKEPEKKPAEKKKGLFGKIKDALTGGDKKKDPKKP